MGELTSDIPQLLARFSLHNTKSVLNGSKYPAYKFRLAATQQPRVGVRCCRMEHIHQKHGLHR